MKCPGCHQQNPPHARFCLGCGVRLALVCASCGTELPGGARFCLQCGGAVAPGTPVTSPSPAPDSYTPKHLAERIINSKSALEGERKQVTVLFADLKGSMELLADRDPEEARKLLDPVLERMIEAVHRYEGTVNQVMGDGIMAHRDPSPRDRSTTRNRPPEMHRGGSLCENTRRNRPEGNPYACRLESRGGARALYADRCLVRRPL
jgi:class 3 adenylate cyclase